jgi:hypothetical protein
MQTELENILSRPRLEPRSFGQTTGALVNSAMPPLDPDFFSLFSTYVGSQKVQ